MTSIPSKVTKFTGIKPGWKLDWILGENPDEILVRVIPDRAEQARRLFGQGKGRTQGKDIIAELIHEREEDTRR
jgi:bifunctional DNA-binding transcriptional regulator/antitoxin component of YhaV-PrlF toxin-antitoxin module